ncbi:MAG: YceD family protein [Flavobacteriaceae bacterium]
MDARSEFKIPFVGLKNGMHLYEFTIDQTFFEAFAYFDFKQPKFNVGVQLNKKEQLLEIELHATGSVGVVCDVSMEPFDLSLNPHFDLIVKFGATYNDENDEILVLPHGSYQIDLSQYVYEMILLSLPQKRVHPQIEDGTLQSPILKKLEELAPKKENDQLENDPRWDKLKDLL